MRRLDENEVFALEKILVKDNKHVVGVRIAHGYMGVGGTNRSGFEAESIREYTIEQLSEREPFWVTGSEICAVVDDVLYFRHEDRDGSKRVYTLDCNQKSYMMLGDGVAYDTVSAVRVVLLFAQE